jgi:hypothetical protein
MAAPLRNESGVGFGAPLAETASRTENISAKFLAMVENQKRLVLKTSISKKAIHPFIVQNWRKATKGAIRVSKKCAQ